MNKSRLHLQGCKQAPCHANGTETPCTKSCQISGVYVTNFCYPVDNGKNRSPQFFPKGAKTAQKSPCFAPKPLQNAPKGPVPVEKAVENPFPAMSGSDSKPCQTDFAPCKHDLSPCGGPTAKPSIFSVFRHFYSHPNRKKRAILPFSATNKIFRLIPPKSPYRYLKILYAPAWFGLAGKRMLYFLKRTLPRRAFYARYL